MAINKLISIKVPVLEALGDMGIDHAKNEADLIRWAVRAEREIGSYYSFRKEIKVLTVDKYRAELPCEAMYVQRVLLGDYGCDTFDLFDVWCGTIKQPLFFTQQDSFLVIDNPGDGQAFTLGGLKWEVQDNHIILTQNYDKQKITIQYVGLCKDEDGFPKVCENHIEAIVAFIMYRFAQRSRFTPNRMDFGDVADLKRDWATLAREARAMDDQFTESQRQEILSILHDPMSGVPINNRWGLYNREEW